MENSTNEINNSETEIANENICEVLKSCNNIAEYLLRKNIESTKMIKACRECYHKAFIQLREGFIK